MQQRRAAAMLGAILADAAGKKGLLAIPIRIRKLWGVAKM